jgi:hypothetical protein
MTVYLNIAMEKTNALLEECRAFILNLVVCIQTNPLKGYVRRESDFMCTSSVMFTYCTAAKGGLTAYS